MSFAAQLDALPDPGERTWIYVPYDQLTDAVGPLSRLAPEDAGIVLVESRAKASRRPYHKQKLAMVLSNQRHFALEQAERGVAVDYRFDTRAYGEVLAEVIEERGELLLMRPAERELRADVAPLVRDGRIRVVPHEGWLTTVEDFATLGEAPWRMDTFYRRVRRRTGMLMEEGKPVGGRFSFDGDNRKFWPGTPEAPSPPSFEPDDITLEVVALIEAHFADHPGRLDATSLPASAADAERLWAWAMTQCMENFGPFEDAMSEASRGLFHTRIAPLLNLHRLLPSRVVADVESCGAPLNSREGFIRQVLGWREFVRHVHEATDGFRRQGQIDVLGRTNPLPAAWWGTTSGLSCLDGAVEAVWDEGWTHHIPRLMVLSNIATLLDLSPRELSDWFWVGFVDAYDWVVEPNVLAMGTYATGDIMTTKPYISGSGYIHRMSDACKSCAFHPKKTCPLTPMYWAFLARHEEALKPLNRMAMPMRSLAKRGVDKRALDAATYTWVSETLAAGEALRPEDAPG